MNYYDAVKLADGSGYHYVSQNRREGTRPVGYCSRIHPCPEGDANHRAWCPEDCSACGGKGYVDKGEEWRRRHVHQTEQSARECFRRYLLHGWREEAYGDWTGCEALTADGAKCDAPTKAGLTTRPPLGHGFPLCDEHRTYEELEALTPPVGQIAASY